MRNWQNAWLIPEEQLAAGCILLVLSGYFFWHSTHAIWHDWGTRFGTFAVIVGPWCVYRAWRRRAESVPDDD